MAIASVVHRLVHGRTTAPAAVSKDGICCCQRGHDFTCELEHRTAPPSPYVKRRHAPLFDFVSRAPASTVPLIACALELTRC